MPVRSILVSQAVGVATAVVMMSSPAAASPRARLAPDLRAPGAPLTAAVCSTGEIRCLSHIRITPAGEIDAAAAPSGYGPAELQSAYQVDPAAGPANAPVIAIVDAFGYPNLESDLATYRAQFGLPPCTVASGCLKIVNQNGQAAPLPPEGPPSANWTIETALDVDVASAMCPRCKLLVVQADDSGMGLFTAHNAAAAAHPTVISDSWGGATQPTDDLSMLEPFFDHPGIAQFAAAGDHGYDDSATGGGNGPLYPGTSAHVIAVGGTALVRAGNARGWTETAWTNGGSACSYSIPKPAYQTKAPCQFRASADISAVGDPATGVAIYNHDADGGWATIGGTSAAAPIVAAVFASIGRGDVTAAQIAQSTSALFDVTSGTNGTCGNLLCNATTGWDGPTGYGTPSAALLSGGTAPGPGPGTLAVAITSPADGASVDAGFQVMATASGAAVVGLFIDGTLLRTAAAPPYVFPTPTSLVFGAHDIQVVAQDAQKNQVVSEIRVQVRFNGGTAGPPPDPETGTGGGCQVGGDPALGLALIAGAVAARRRRRA